jgi:hypothetical protein
MWRSTGFVGSLKQLSVEDYPEFLRALFAMLFPRFSDVHDWSWEDHPETKKELESIPGVRLVPWKSPRRYGGYALPRRRYHTLCVDGKGDDHGTLVHELRAYRDPVRTGMVEVMDLGLGSTAVGTGTEWVAFERAPELGVFIHRPDLLDGLLGRISHEMLESPTGDRIALVRFPYRVAGQELAQVLDLRIPESRAWFAEEFSKPNSDWRWPDDIHEPVGVEYLSDPPETLVSIYERSIGQAPIPRSFIEMLPTLLNPDRGGGQLPGGFTLMAIGEWLRNHGADALIYPSARSNAFAIVEQGRLEDFGGWCLVDYRYDRSEDAAHYVVIDQSPWSWVALPPGAGVAIGDEGSTTAGTLVISGIVEQGTNEYLHQIASLKAAEEAIGPGLSEVTPREAFAWGAFMFRWLHLAFVSADVDDVATAYRISCGLTLRNRRELLAGRIRWIYKRLAADGDAAPALEELARTSSEIESGLPEGIRDIFGAAADLELVLMQLTRATLSGMETVPSGLAVPALRRLVLPSDLAARAEEFLDTIESPESRIDASSLATVELIQRLLQFFGKQDHQKRMESP